jgi:hypothetical protein
MWHEKKERAETSFNDFESCSSRVEFMDSESCDEAVLAEAATARMNDDNNNEIVTSESK